MSAITVLCIEDEADLREDIAEELRAADYIVLEAGNGKEGLAVIKEHCPDLVLCDVNMPEMTGHELVQKLRDEHKSMASMPFIFLSALGGRNDVIDGIKFGADDYLTKPIDFDLLLATIEARLLQVKRIRDVNEEDAKKRDEEAQLTKTALHRYVHYDEVTGIPNRAKLMACLRKALVPAREEGNRVVLVYFELEQFSSINNRYGQAIADKVLKAVAGRLSTRLGQFSEQFSTGEHHSFVASFGLASFGILLPIVSDQLDLSNYIDDLMGLTSKPFVGGDREVFVVANVGIAQFPADGKDEKDIQGAAAIALHVANRDGHGTCRFYDPVLDEEIKNQAEMEQTLHAALKREEFELHYQPQLDAVSGKIVGVEALIRWRHPERGLVSPGDFIPLAESTGLIIPMTEWALAEACRQANEWHGLGVAGLRMAVNLSPTHLGQAGFVEMVARIVEESGLDFGDLELEITESAIVEEGGDELNTLTRLRDLGIELAIDDFGTGYSSFSYLKRFPFDTLKIDQSFVRGLENDDRDNAIVEAIVKIARSHNLQLVAEGVETEEQLQRLKAFGCDRLQGFLFSRPLPPGEFLKFAKAQNTTGVA